MEQIKQKDIQSGHVTFSQDQKVINQLIHIWLIRNTII